ncbi:hypothetical protein NUW58_g7696 [Xylaria curta]|uniref:Uncharacterized protein n=1 Tax=Xylaria curta TaxID=42375 RepID=A0ACC1NFG7_9PEZI|nr:hypothetical protein NUW58_g7696 [Xylaria curta]
MPPGPNTAEHDADTPLSTETANEDRTADLLFAAYCGDLQRVRSVLDKSSGEDRNAYVTARGMDGQTPLHYVSYGPECLISKNTERSPEDLSIGHSEIAGLLIEHATDKNQYVTMQDNGGQTALHIAAMGDANLEIIERLISEATDKNQYITLQDNCGFTALHFAAKGGEYLVVERLINEATDKNQYVTMETRDGRTALHLAAARGNFEVRITSTEPPPAAGCRNIGVADVRQSKNARDYINKKDAAGYTPLHEAAVHNASSVASFLLRIGANPEARNMEQNTAWDLAGAPGQERWEVIAAFISEEYYKRRLWGDKTRSLWGGKTRSLPWLYENSVRAYPLRS